MSARRPACSVVSASTVSSTPLAQPQPAATGAQWGEHSLWTWQDHQCHWRVLGDRNHRALVMIHGFGAASGHWRHNAAELAAAGWCVFAIDLVGFGASSQPGHRRHRPLDNRLWARQLQAFLEQVVQGPAVLVGNSLGSLVAVTCAVFFPTWVAGVVAAPLPDPTLLMPLKRRRRPWRRQLKRSVVVILCRLLPLELLVPLIARTPLLDLGLRSAYNDQRAVDRELRRLIARPALRPQAARALRAMSIGMALRPHGATAAPLLERMQQPLLVVWGSQDRLVPPLISQRLKHHKSDLELRLLPELGHCPHDEQPALFNRHILGWLARNLGNVQPREQPWA